MRKDRYKCNFACPVPIMGLRSHPSTLVDENGLKQTVIVAELVDLADPANDVSMPTDEEYQLQKLIDSGVPLKEVVGKVLNPTDSANRSALLDMAAGNAYASASADVDLHVPEPEPDPEPNSEP